MSRESRSGGGLTARRPGHRPGNRHRLRRNPLRRTCCGRSAV